MDAVTRRTYADTVAHGTKTAMPAVRRLLWISMVLLAAGAAARAADLTVQQISVVLAKASASSPADFSHRDLSYLDLSDLDFKHADLSGANLYGVDLAFADLTGADLSHANLAHADLAHADLTGADLTGADLSDADLDETVLRRARGLSQAKGIDTARHHDTTIR